MTEFDLRSVSPENGYPREPVILWLDLYRLISVVGASKYLTKFRRHGEFSHYDMHSIFRNFEYSELSSLLISIAGKLRNEIDCKVSDKKSVKVGFIKYKKIKSLSIKSACSKILHADFINFDLYGKQEDIYGGYIKSKIYLYGEEDGEEWKATICLDKFVEEAFNIF